MVWMYLNYLLLHPFSPPSSYDDEGSASLSTKASRLARALDTLPGAFTASPLQLPSLLNHSQHLTNIFAWFPHQDGPLWPLISFQVIPIFSSHLHCATSQKSHLHSHQHIGCLKVLHCHLLLSSFALGFIHTPSTYDSPLLILHSPLQTFQFNVPHRHFRPNVLKTKLITLNFFIKIHFSVSPASCVAGLGDNSSSRVHSL